MSLLDVLKSFASSVDTEYDRRIRAASNVKQYRIGGHGAHGDHADDHMTFNEFERLKGEGGALGDLQSNSGPQLNDVTNREQVIAEG